MDIGDYMIGTDTIPAIISLNSPVDGSSTFPVFHTPMNNSLTSFRIYRSPVASTTQTFSFPRDVVIDFTYSGIGIDGNQFAPQGAVANAPIDLIFGPDGRIDSITQSSLGGSVVPSGLIFLCVGKTDGVRADAPFATTTRPPANLMNEDSAWIVINSTTGRSVVAPRAVVNDTSSMAAALRESRTFAVLSDTLDATP
jgi:hypothetical protein